MISYKELLHGHAISEIPIAHQHNLEELLVRINVIREAYGLPMIVNSGYRTKFEQMNINPKAPNSWHCVGKAVDIADVDGTLNTWCKEHLEVLEKAGLWLEERQGVWQHFQSEPPKSGKRFFTP